MAGVEHETRTNDTIGKTGDAVEKAKKSNGIFKQLKKGIGKFIPKSPQKPVEPQPEPILKKEITAEYIKEQIEKNELWEASKNLITLEREIYGTEDDTHQQDKKKELKCLCEDLSTAVFKVIKDSITESQGDLLFQAVQAIVEQEKEDAEYVSDTGSLKVNSSRPKQWKIQWENYIKLSVAERIDSLPDISATDTSSSLSQRFVAIGKTLKKDLIHAVNNVKPHYPDEFDICNTYAKHYHAFMMSQMDIFTEYEVGAKDTYFILLWVKSLYPNTILNDPALVGHIDKARLESLLPSYKISQLETSYVSNEIDSMGTYMARILELEENRWKSGNEPEILGGYYHSELHIDLIQCFIAGIQKASEAQLQISHLLTTELLESIKRYKKMFSEYLEKNKSQTFFTAICIANLNCCLKFRDFVGRQDSKIFPHMKNSIQNIMGQLEDHIHDALFEDLFVELKSHFRKISQGNGLCSHQTMTDIIKITDRHLEPFTTLCAPCYKSMIVKIHKHLVKEYLARLLKKKVSHKNATQLQTLSNQINENAKLIDEFFVFHNSEEGWLKLAILKVSEIIRLQDLNAIQLEVATLVKEFPDIRDKQIEAILYIKGNLTRHEVKTIMKIPDSIVRVSDKPKLFELI